MRPPSKPALLGLVIAAFALACGVRLATAADYDVPDVFPTLQDAVAAASGSGDQLNAILINDPVVFTSAVVSIDDSFGWARQLVIRPDPGAGLDRATIASVNGSARIFTLVDAAYVTFQDLDIVRNTTNNNDLILLDYAGNGNHHIVFERCRIGSIWTTPGSEGWRCLVIQKPTEIVVRSCIFFAYAPGTFDRAVDVSLFTDPANSIRLYNNVVADHEEFGISIENGLAGTAVVLRNNAVSNHPSLVPEPVAYRSNIVVGVTVVSSHNVAFATPAAIEDQIGAQALIPPGDPTFIRLDRPLVDDAFVERVWDLVPAWDPNPDFFRLAPGGALHNEPADNGVTVADGAPHPLDVKVADDVEGDPRPSGAPLHTDRGADQIEGLATGVGTGGVSGPALWAAPLRNPAPAVLVRFRTRESGRVTLDVFDPSGRRLYATERPVTAGESGLLEWPGGTGPGIIVYRVLLEPRGGPPSWTSGRIAIVR